jgi:hypothetical protein
MKQMTTSEFRSRFPDIDEPVEIRKYREMIGTYIPAGSVPIRGPITPDKTGDVKREDIARKGQKHRDAVDAILGKIPRLVEW